MDKRTGSVLVAPSSSLGKAAKREREHSTSTKRQRPSGNKTKRPSEQPGSKKSSIKENQSPEELTVKGEIDGVGKSSFTVVDVDNVREKEEEEKEESLGLLETDWHEEGLKNKDLGVCEWLLMLLVLSIVLLFLPISIWFCVKVVREHERAVIFRLGHLLRGRQLGPGLLFYLPLLDVCKKVDIRLKMLKVPSHMVVTKDLVRTELSAVCYYRVENVAVCSTALVEMSTVLKSLVQMANRDIMAHHNFSDILLERRSIGREIQVIADAVACQWGIKVEKTEIEDLFLPVELQHSIAAEAEAKRQAQIKVISAEGERAACEALKASLDSLSSSPAGVQLRLLQLLHTLHTDRPALVLTLPSDLLTLPPDLTPPPPPPPPAKPHIDGDTDSPMM
ncbi:podocin [Aplochiton taeniatus]